MSTTRRVTLLFQKQVTRIHIQSLSTLPMVSKSKYNTYSHQQTQSQFIHYSSKLSFCTSIQKTQKNESYSDSDNDSDNDSEYEENIDDEEDQEEDTEEDSEEEEEEEQFEYGIDSDDEFTDNLSYDVRDDPWFDEMLPVDQQKYLFSQRHKNPEAWRDQLIPHAVKTSNYDYNTIKAVKRYPNLGKYCQSYTQFADSKWNFNLNNVKINTQNTIENGLLYNQPKYKDIMPMIHNREVRMWKNPDIDYRVKSGDMIELIMYTNLQKKKIQKNIALCLMVKKKYRNTGNIMIRNVEKDGLTVIRQYPLHGPWIKSLKILQRYKAKRNKLYYMYKAPASIIDPVQYGNSIGVRSRSEHFKWLKETDEGMQYARDYRLKRKMYFHGMRYRQPWAKRLADLYYATAMTKNMKGPYRNAKREMKYRLRLKPHKIA